MHSRSKSRSSVIFSMEFSKVLARIAGRSCHMEDVEPMARGSFIRTLVRCAEMEPAETQSLFEYILADLVGTGSLKSCEFHEGLDGIIDSDRMIEILVMAYPCETGESFGKIFVDLFAVGRLKPSQRGWNFVRSSMGRSEFRAMLVRLMEESFDRLSQIPKLLGTVYDIDSEQFDIAETIRLALDTNWISDILPSKRRQARQALSEQFVRPFPFAVKYVDDFVRDALRLEPLQADGMSQESILSQPNGVRPLSDDSDLESLGSLDDFVVDDDENDGSGDSSDDSSSSSNYSDPEPKRKKSKLKRKKKSYSSVSDGSSSYSTS